MVVEQTNFEAQHCSALRMTIPFVGPETLQQSAPECFVKMRDQDCYKNTKVPF